MKRGLVWFRNNLRLADNEPLVRAIEENDEILLVYIFEDQFWETDAWGNCRTGLPRTKFLTEAVNNLAANLNAIGGNLLITRGDAIQVLSALMQAHDISTIYTPASFTHNERKQEATLGRIYNVKTYWESSLIHPDDLPFVLDKLPDVFTAFRNKIEKYCSVRSEFETPTIINAIKVNHTDTSLLPSYTGLKADTRAVVTFLGGEEKAQERLTHYFEKSHAIATYKETRNGLLGADYSSKFSPWLAQGCISAKSIYWALKAYEIKYGANDSTYWLYFELLWRDFFRFVALKFGNKLFLKSGLKQTDQNATFSPKWYEKWKTGQLREPFVDANMRELMGTGFMSNRGRQNVASYWVHNLKQDWRAGAAWFESQLIDFDAASNYGNWLYVAGIGNDPRPNRIFNVQKQAAMYDPDGEYVQHWLALP